MKGAKLRCTDGVHAPTIRQRLKPLSWRLHARTTKLFPSALEHRQLTVSDTRTRANDKSGDVLQERAESAGHAVVRRDIQTDDLDALVARLNVWIDDEDVDVILTTGGTGVTGRDITPEAVEAVGEKHIPGFGEPVPLAQLHAHLDIHHPVSSDGGGESRHIHLRAARFAGSVSRCMGRHPRRPTDIRHKPLHQGIVPVYANSRRARRR